MGDCPRALFLMIIVYDQCGMNNSRYPAQQGQEEKLAIRPVISTASGGSTTQKKYRNAFISAFF